MEENEILEKIVEETTQFCEHIDHPAHYAEGRKYEPIEVIADWKLDFALGNTVKYISRAGRKDSAAMNIDEKTIEDLKKAKWYLEWEINHILGKKV